MQDVDLQPEHIDLQFMKLTLAVHDCSEPALCLPGTALENYARLYSVEGAAFSHLALGVNSLCRGVCESQDPLS